MTASSFYKNDENYKPAYGRLHGNRGDGWCASTANGSDWLQVDLGRVFQLCAVATQGDRTYDQSDEWVTDFKLSYSSDGNTWTNYTDGNGIEVVRLMVFIVIKTKCASILLYIAVLFDQDAMLWAPCPISVLIKTFVTSHSSGISTIHVYGPFHIWKTICVLQVRDKGIPREAGGLKSRKNCP